MLLSALLKSHDVIWPFSTDSALVVCIAAMLGWISGAALCQKRFALQHLGWQATSAV